MPVSSPYPPTPCTPQRWARYLELATTQGHDHAVRSLAAREGLPYDVMCRRVQKWRERRKAKGETLPPADRSSRSVYPAAWALYLELHAQVGHYGAIRAMAEQRGEPYELTRRFVNGLRQWAGERKRYAVPPIDPAALRQAKAARSPQARANVQAVPATPQRVKPPPPTRTWNKRAKWDAGLLQAVLDARGMSRLAFCELMGNGQRSRNAEELVAGRRHYPQQDTLDKVAAALNIDVAVIQGDYVPASRVQIARGNSVTQSRPPTPPTPPRSVKCPAPPSEKPAQARKPGKRGDTPQSSQTTPARRPVRPPPGTVAVTTFDEFLLRLMWHQDRRRLRGERMEEEL